MANLEQRVSKQIGKTIYDYKMIQDGDKILVCVSGGKDSLTLLYDLIQRKKIIPVKYEIAAVHVATDISEDHNKEELRDLFHSWGVDYFFVDLKVVHRLKEGKKFNCYWCAMQRRIEILKVAAANNFNKIALGHNLDDIVETFLMNMFYKSELSGMKLVFKYDRFPFTIIRPLGEVREESIKLFIERTGLKNLAQNCPYNDNTKRAATKKIIDEMRKENKLVREHIFTAIKNVNTRFLGLSD
ncbi:MAG TPA: ATP-binding protein [Spirochaetota bacterium]|nr:ATP-binding protein [Spirochaetota bacterium]